MINAPDICLQFQYTPNLGPYMYRKILGILRHNCSTLRPVLFGKVFRQTMVVWFLGAQQSSMTEVLNTRSAVLLGRYIFVLPWDGSSLRNWIGAHLTGGVK